MGKVVKLGSKGNIGSIVGYYSIVGPGIVVSVVKWVISGIGGTIRFL